MREDTLKAQTEGVLQRQFFEMLVDSQWWSASALRNLQASQLAQLVRHAAENVPFYRGRLDRSLENGHEFSWDNWIRLPVITRSDLQVYGSTMLARTVPPGHGDTAVYRSSGSSGQPIEVTVNGLVTLVNTALRWRFHEWNALDWQLPQAIWQLEPGEVPHNSARKLGPWGPPWKLQSTGNSWAFAKDHDLADMAKFLAASGCRYVNRGPKAMHVFALECERQGVTVSLDAVLTQGEACDAQDRSVFQRVFGARALELYSAKEGGHLAHPCEAGSLHVAEEAVLLEILDDHGLPCPVGVAGRVTITPFYFTAQPLIRYQLGDIAEFGPPCSCGRHSRTLSRIHGRATAIFTHPDGRAICRFFPVHAKSILQCGLWQLAQVGPLDFEIRYVPAGVADELQFTELFRDTFFSDASLAFRPVPEIPPTAAGKVLEYVNETRGV